LLAEAVTGSERGLLRRRQASEHALPIEPKSAPDETGLIASEFRRLVADHGQQQMAHRQECRRAEAERHAAKPVPVLGVKSMRLRSKSRRSSGHFFDYHEIDGCRIPTREW
jgi:hypothetical protein